MGLLTSKGEAGAEREQAKLWVEGKKRGDLGILRMRKENQEEMSSVDSWSEHCTSSSILPPNFSFRYICCWPMFWDK